MSDLAPIVLFAYNRPTHTQKTLRALSQNKLAENSELFIYCDGPKKEASLSELSRINEVKEIVINVSSFKETHIIRRKKNFGLAKNIINGITEVINNYGKIIVLEDDIITSPYFLSFMNKALNKYEKNKKVMHISGFLYEGDNQGKLPDTFFLKFMSCWGWATWKDRWQLFNGDPSYLLSKIKADGKLDEFNLDGVINFDKQLEGNINGEISTWAIKWFSTIFLKDGLCLYPNKSYVRNIGIDGSGVHSKSKQDIKRSKAYVSDLAEKVIKLDDIEIKESEIGRSYLKRFFNKKNSNISLLIKLKRYIKDHIKFKSIFN